MNPDLYFDNLGKPARDKVTQFEGVIESVCFDLYGCVLFMLRPVGLDKNGASKPGEWFDIARIKIEPGEAVMPPPVFINHAEPVVRYTKGVVQELVELDPTPAQDGRQYPKGPAVHPDTRRR